MSGVDILHNPGITADEEISSDSYFPCFQCGLCCHDLKIRVTEYEARKICQGLGLSWPYFRSNYLDNINDGTSTYYLRQRDNACIFLKPVSDKKRNICLIHNWKPFVCREWEADYHRRQCQEGLLKYWGITVTQDGKLDGKPEDIEKFREFLNTIT